MYRVGRAEGAAARHVVRRRRTALVALAGDTRIDLRAATGRHAAGVPRWRGCDGGDPHARSGAGSFESRGGAGRAQSAGGRAAPRGRAGRRGDGRARHRQRGFPRRAAEDFSDGVAGNPRRAALARASAKRRRDRPGAHARRNSRARPARPRAQRRRRWFARTTPWWWTARRWSRRKWRGSW